jgi:hypothetical protein
MMRRLGVDCINGSCPAVYLDDPNTVVVQGKHVTRPDVTLGPGEILVEIPRDKLEEAARCLTSESF